MFLYFIASISRNTVHVCILNIQISQADSEHELKCVLIVYAFMHFDFVKLDLSQKRMKVRILNKYVNHADFFLNVLYNFVYSNIEGFFVYSTHNFTMGSTYDIKGLLN